MEILILKSSLLIMNQNAIVYGTRLMQFVLTANKGFKTPLHIQILSVIWVSPFI